jgi:hypothetical protein
MTKFKLIILTLLTLFLTTSIFTSCSEDENTFNETTSSNINIKEFNKNSNAKISYDDDKYLINYISTIEGNDVISTVKIKNKNSNSIINTVSFVLEKKSPSFKLNVSKKIEEISSKIKNSLTVNEWIQVRNSYKSFLKESASNYQIKDKNLMQSTFYHLSIYNTIIRSFNTTDCECTPLPAYLIGKRPFWCQEDYTLNKNILLNHFNQNKEKLLTFKDGQKFYDYVKMLDPEKENITFRELFELSYSIKEYKDAIQKNSTTNTLNKNREDCFLGLLGSDIGCCGNYSGCCWAASLFCFVHDSDCINCAHWHCGWACEPS